MLLLLLGLWTLWATRFSVVHKSTGLPLGLAEVEGGDPVGVIVDIEDAILIGGAKGDILATKGLADAPSPSPQLSWCRATTAPRA